MVYLTKMQVKQRAKSQVILQQRLQTKPRAEVQVLHYPNLKTILAIEEAIKQADVAISRNKLFQKLENKVMRSTLNVALEYLEQHGIILETRYGFIWSVNNNEKLRKAEESGLRV